MNGRKDGGEDGSRGREMVGWRDGGVKDERMEGWIGEGMEEWMGGEMDW